MLGLLAAGALAGGADPARTRQRVPAKRIEMTEDDIAAFRSRCPEDGSSTATPTSTDSAPDVVDELAGQLTDDGRFRTCPELVASVATQGWRTRVRIAETRPVLVLTLLGQG